MQKNYAIITFRKDGPLKSWSAVRGAHTHNHRVKPISHGELMAGGVHVLHGSTDLVGDVRGTLVKHGIDPDSGIRSGGVIAYECVLTASPAFFDEGDERARYDRLCEWSRAQMRFLVQKYGVDRLASLVLHLDEKTPHMHAVVVPLVFGPDGRRSAGGSSWRLCGRLISGPGEFLRLQDEYAKAMAPLGLERGERGKGQKHKPVREYMAEIAAKQAQAAAELERAERDRQHARQMREEATEALRRASKFKAEQEALCVQMQKDEWALRQARAQFAQAQIKMLTRSTQIRLLFEDLDAVPLDELPPRTRAFLEGGKTMFPSGAAIPQLPANAPDEVLERIDATREPLRRHAAFMATQEAAARAQRGS